MEERMAKYDKQKFVDFLNEKWKGRACPICGGGPWNVSDDVFEIRDYNNGNLVIGGGPIVPVIAVTCMNCGNTIFVNAILAGAIKRNNGDDNNGK